MREAVLAPIGMTHSSFEQPLPPALAATTAAGLYAGGKPVKGRWHVYPEMAAAGLWTTPSDLARFAIEVQGSLLRPHVARDLTCHDSPHAHVERDNDGLGVFLQGKGRTLLFNHGGRDDGFDASLNVFAETGQGLVGDDQHERQLANDEPDRRLRGEEVRLAGAAHRRTSLRWRARSRFRSSGCSRTTGRYELSNNNMLTLIALNGRLFVATNGCPTRSSSTVGGGVHVTDRDSRVGFVRDAAGTITALTWTRGDNTRTAPRIGPLVSMLARQADPDPALTTACRCPRSARWPWVGPRWPTRPRSRPAPQRDFSRGGPWPAGRKYRGIAFIGAQDVSGRMLERHGHPVARIAYYTLTTDAGQRALIGARHERCLRLLKLSRH